MTPAWTTQEMVSFPPRFLTDLQHIFPYSPWLTGFVAVVGLNAGPDFVRGLQTSGPSLVVAGALTITIPLLIGVVVGRWLFKLHPGVLLGVCAGACTATPALAAVQEAAKSTVPSLGYGVAYAVGNVLLAIWGTVIVALLA